MVQGLQNREYPPMLTLPTDMKMQQSVRTHLSFHCHNLVFFLLNVQVKLESLFTPLLCVELEARELSEWFVATLRDERLLLCDRRRPSMKLSLLSLTDLALQALPDKVFLVLLVMLLPDKVLLVLLVMLLPDKVLLVLLVCCCQIKCC